MGHGGAVWWSGNLVFRNRWGIPWLAEWLSVSQKACAAWTWVVRAIPRLIALWWIEDCGKSLENHQIICDQDMRPRTLNKWSQIRYYWSKTEVQVQAFIVPSLFYYWYWFRVKSFNFIFSRELHDSLCKSWLCNSIMLLGGGRGGIWERLALPLEAECL